jgi:hypothetical protein
MLHTPQAQSSDFLYRASAKRDQLITSLRQALSETAFSNQKFLAPRHLALVSEQETEEFFGYLQSRDEEMVRTHGQGLARKGLGHRSILAMMEALRHFCRESVNPGEAVAARYANALLEGYMAGRESNLLQEQERTREAFLRALDANKSLKH